MKMVLVSTTKEAIIGDAEYFSALREIEKYALDSKQDSVLVRGFFTAKAQKRR